MENKFHANRKPNGRCLGAILGKCRKLQRAYTTGEITRDEYVHHIGTIKYAVRLCYSVHGQNEMFRRPRWWADGFLHHA